MLRVTLLLAVSATTFSAAGCIFLVDDAASGGGGAGGGAGVGAGATATSSSTDSGGAGGPPAPCSASFRPLITAAELAPNASPPATIEDVDSDGTRIAVVVGPGTDSQAERTLYMGTLTEEFAAASIHTRVATTMRVDFAPGAPQSLVVVWDSSSSSACVVRTSAQCEDAPESPVLGLPPQRIESLGPPTPLRAITLTTSQLGWIELTNTTNDPSGDLQTAARDLVAVPGGVVISAAGETYLCSAAASADLTGADCSHPADGVVFTEETIGLSATANNEGLALVAGIVDAPTQPTDRQVRLALIASSSSPTPIPLTTVIEAAASVAISPSGLVVSKGSVFDPSLTLCCGESGELVSLTSPDLDCGEVASGAPLFLELVPHGARQVIGRTKDALYLIELTPISG